MWCLRHLFPKKGSRWILVAGKSPHHLHCKAKQRRQSRYIITQRWCQLPGEFQTRDLSCILKCQCSAWKAVPGSTGVATEGKTQAKAINFYQTVQWHTNCFCIKVVLPSWKSSEERWNMPSLWTRSSSRAALDPRHPWSISPPPLPFLPPSPAHSWCSLMELVASAGTGVQESPAAPGHSQGKCLVLQWFPFFFTAPLHPLPSGKHSWLSHLGTSAGCSLFWV